MGKEGAWLSLDDEKLNPHWAGETVNLKDKLRLIEMNASWGGS